jgi:hypothetical protein
MLKIRRPEGLLPILGFLAALCLGCNNPKDVSFNSIKNNPTPELMGMSEREIDVERNMAVVGNQNLRLMWGDLGRVWLFDQPSILSPWNTVSTSGQPN